MHEPVRDKSIKKPDSENELELETDMNVPSIVMGEISNWIFFNIKKCKAEVKADVTSLFYIFLDDEFGEKTVSILLDGEESEMIFIDHPTIEMSVSTLE